MPNNLVQDRSIPTVIVGTDVVSFYPNIKLEAAGEKVYQAIMDTTIQLEGMNYKEGVRYLALVRGYDWFLKSKLRRVLPSKRYAHGTLPGITEAGPLGPNCNGEEQWISPM